MYVKSQSYPLSSFSMNSTISSLEIVPPLSSSKVSNTSSKASGEKTSPDPKTPRLASTNFLSSSLLSSPDLSMSYSSKI